MLVDGGDNRLEQVNKRWDGGGGAASPVLGEKKHALSASLQLCSASWMHGGVLSLMSCSHHHTRTEKHVRSSCVFVSVLGCVGEVGKRIRTITVHTRRPSLSPSMRKMRTLTVNTTLSPFFRFVSMAWSFIFLVLFS